ncbi:lamina-associated polypeptide 2, isoforms beta/gamma-like isoform X4 [Poecile atricapillus]|uniref:lamina-associated polypeptide 2, isoforms beta/gamma-like isoform X4 n=1 Tax=Poecile atricapillus TaxID=48891 RepID=UPI00273977E9|nr:lamina-associated polypeptide 2, isoforms beta/gamma-like isoform X4 [Poecile atricapillus]XP_058718844.1 lamina-associated polypeptide 2, isoforms beta/gamma-like isoform X4 [Poecile atricapillus]
MPEFLADPSVLTKEKLKSELIANNVSLPGGEQRKDVYVQLYLQHLTARNPPALAQPDFSSDEEREPTPLGARSRGAAAAGRKATKKTDKPRPEEKDDLDVTEMSNEDLQEQLMKYGVNPGPIVATTRKLYEKKLLKLMEQGPDLKGPVPLPAISTTENTKQNGNNDSDQYSDNEEDPKTELRLEKREPLKARTKAAVALKQKRVVEHNQVLERTTEERRIERDILKELFPYEVSTPTGISASCRRPIKGAASRPLEHSDFILEESYSKYAQKYGTSTDTKSEKPAVKKQRPVPLWIKVFLFVVVSVFMFLVYQSMETNQGNPFSKYMNIVTQGSAK